MANWEASPDPTGSIDCCLVHVLSWGHAPGALHTRRSAEYPFPDQDRNCRLRGRNAHNAGFHHKLHECAMTSSFGQPNVQSSGPTPTFGSAKTIVTGTCRFSSQSGRCPPGQNGPELPRHTWLVGHTSELEWKEGRPQDQLHNQKHQPGRHRLG